MNEELYHHGIKGMHWGIRRYQNPDGSLTAAGKKRQQRSEQKEITKASKEVKGNLDFIKTISEGAYGLPREVYMFRDYAVEELKKSQKKYEKLTNDYISKYGYAKYDEFVSRNLKLRRETSKSDIRANDMYNKIQKGYKPNKYEYELYKGDKRYSSTHKQIRNAMNQYNKLADEGNKLYFKRYHGEKLSKSEVDRYNHIMDQLDDIQKRYPQLRDKDIPTTNADWKMKYEK